MPTVTRSLLAAAVAASLLVASSASAGTLDDIRASGTIRIAYREDAAPYRAAASEGRLRFRPSGCKPLTPASGDQEGPGTRVAVGGS